MTKQDTRYLSFLPKWWTPETGLKYPTTLHFSDGTSIPINSYEEHYSIVKKLCINK